MLALIANVEFWKALPSLLWPIVTLGIFFGLRRYLDGILKKDDITIEVGGQKILLKSATQFIGKDLAELQARVAKIESLAEAQLAAPVGCIEPNSSECKTPDAIEHLQAQVQEHEESPESEPITNVLWVDDFPQNNAFLVERLRSEKVNVVTALSTKEALEKINSYQFDVIISDLGRIENGKNNALAGVEFLNILKNQKNTKPVAIFAGSRGLMMSMQLQELGAEIVTTSSVDVLRFISKYKRKSS